MTLDTLWITNLEIVARFVRIVGDHFFNPARKLQRWSFERIYN